MCLDTLTKHREPTRTTYDGWKVFAFDYDGSLYGVCISYEVPTGHWLQASGTYIKGDGFKYRAGFHAFKTRAGARAWGFGAGIDTIRKVRLRGVVAEGVQEGNEVLVAKEMFVPKRRRK